MVLPSWNTCINRFLPRTGSNEAHVELVSCRLHVHTCFIGAYPSLPPSWCRCVLSRVKIHHQRAHLRVFSICLYFFVITYGWCVQQENEDGEIGQDSIFLLFLIVHISLLSSLCMSTCLLHLVLCNLLFVSQQ
jgi:hypothetical protein